MLGIDAKAAKYTWTSAVVLLLMGLVYLIRETIVVFILALLFAYLLYPLMDVISRRVSGRRRTPALAMTYVIVLGLLAVFVTLIGSRVVEQAKLLAQHPPDPQKLIQDFASRYPQLQPIIDGLDFRERAQGLVQQAPKIAVRILSESSNLIYVVIIPILAFFILKDGRQIRDGLLNLLGDRVEAANEALADAHLMLLQYMRALLYLCLATLVAFMIVLNAMGVPYAILLASIACPLEFIPLIGPLIAAITIIAVSALSGYAHVLWVAVFLLAFRTFQDYVLSPHLMSRGVELHPLFVLFGVFAGGELGGVVGIFLSVPVLAFIRLMYHRLTRTRRIGQRPVLTR